MKIFVLMIILLSIISCSNSDSPSEEVNKTSYAIGKGFEYLPISEYQILSFQVLGEEFTFELDYDLRYSRSLDAEQKLFIYKTENTNSLILYPVYAYNNDGRLFHSPHCFLSITENEIIGKDEPDDKVSGLVIPNEIQVGTEWIVNSFDIVKDQFVFKITDHLNTWISAQGKSYTDVIEISCLRYDSTYTENQNKKTYVESASGKIYLARNIGIVGGNASGYIRESKNSYGYESGKIKYGKYYFYKKD